MKIQHIGIAVFITFIWGSAFAIIEIGLSEFPPIFNTSLRFLTASIPWVFFIKRPNISWLFLFAFGMNYVFMFSLMYTAMNAGVPSGLTSLILQSSVIFALMVSAFLFKDTPSAIQISGILIGIFGIVLIGLDKNQNFGMIPFLIMLGAAFFYGLSSILIKKAGDVDMLSLLVWGCLIPPIPLLLMSLIFENNQWESLMSMSLTGLFSIYYTSLLGTILAFALWGYLLKRYPTHIVVPFHLLVPVFGVITSYLLLNQALTPRVILSSIIILLSLTVICFHQNIENWLSFLKLKGRQESA